MPRVIHIPGRPVPTGDGGGGGSSLLTTIVGYWTFNAAATGPYLDSVNNSTMTAFVSIGGKAVTSVVGRISNALRFEGVLGEQSGFSEGVSTPHNSNIATAATSFTLNFWYNVDRNGVWPSFRYPFLRKANTDMIGDVQLTSFEWSVDHAGSSDPGAQGLIFTRGNGNTSITHSTQAGVTHNNEWLMATAIYDAAADTMALEVSSQTSGFRAHLSPVISAPDFVTAASPGALIVGNITQTAEGNPKFTVDEMGLWLRLLTLTEKTTLWNNGLGSTHPFT